MRSLALGIPTIVSDHGPLRDVPQDAAKRLPAEAEPRRLAEAIEETLSDEKTRRKLTEGGLRYARDASVDRVAGRLLAEAFGAI